MNAQLNAARIGGYAMLQLFEVPVCAVKRETLRKKTQELCKKVKAEHPDSSETHICDLTDLMYPYRLWTITTSLAI